MGLTVSNGYVVYQRGANNREHTPWWYIHQRALADASTIKSIQTGDRNNKLQEAGQRLISLGQSEQAKEIALIQSATGTTLSGAEDVREFIRNFNEVLMGKRQFEKAIYRLEDALTKPKQKADSRAPTIASWFTSYLGMTLSKNINNFIDQNLGSLMEQDFSVWEVRLDSIIDNSIDQAFNQMMTKMEKKEGEDLYGDQETWKEIYDASQQIQNFNSYFREMIRSKIDFSRIQNLLKEDIDLQNKKNRGIRKKIDGPQGLNLKNERKSRSVGGSVEKYIMSAASMLGTAAQAATSSGTRVFTSGKARADNVTLFSYEANIDAEKMAQNLANMLNESLTNSASLKNVTEIMRNFYNNHLSKLDNSFIVYGSTKSYSLSESFRGFHGTGSKHLTDAVDIIQQAGIGNSAAVDSYIKAAYNTGEGAIFADKRAEIQDDLKTALMSAAAELLFDDWISIGAPSSGAKAIHVLQLEGIQLPLSVFLIAAGKAMVNASADMERIIKISIKLPGPIKYPEPIQTTGGHMSEILAKWEEQAAIAAGQSSFSMIFLTNFKSLISSWIAF